MTDKLKIKCSGKIKKIAKMDGVSVGDEIEIAIGLYCTIRSLSPEQQHFIDRYIQKVKNGN